jgi:outer membrane protein OmpA-like peptidoglycan-associated protein
MRFKAVFVVMFFLLVFGGFEVFLSADQDALEHPVFKPMPGSTLREQSSKRQDYSTFKFRIKEGSAVRSVEKSGQFWELRYEFRDAAGKINSSISRAEVIGNYVSAVKEKGGEIHSQGSNYLVFSIPRQGGGTSWVKLTSNAGNYVLSVIDEEALDPVLSFGAEELKLALDAEGRVAVYGINFAVNEAFLQLGAEEVIKEFVKLLQVYPDLKIEIQGHTDNTGSAEHNHQLSKRRADAVKQYMQLFGVDSSRMVSKGYGMTQPLADNGMEEGRAQNRRVELVKIK